MRIGVIGGLNLDILGMPNAPLSLRDSNPGRVTLRAGGVGHNIGARLAAMGHRVTMLTALGSDAQADTLKVLCEKDAIDLSHALNTDKHTCTYLCLHDHTGDMYAAVNDMHAVDDMTPERILPLLPALDGCKLCVMDTNPPAETLLACAKALNMPVFVDPVSVFKGHKMLPMLPYVQAIKPNLMEARALTGEEDPEKAARRFLEMGAKQVFISMGGDGVLYADKDTLGVAPALPLPAGTALTGAGDSLCGGLIEGILQGLDTRETAYLGCKTAHDTLIELSRNMD